MCLFKITIKHLVIYEKLLFLSIDHWIILFSKKKKKDFLDNIGIKLLFQVLITKKKKKKKTQCKLQP